MHPTSNDQRLQELFAERERNKRTYSKPHSLPTWSYAVVGCDNKATNMIWLSEGYCGICSSTDNLQLLIVDGRKQILCNSCTQLEAMEYEVLSYGRLDTAVKNLHSTNSIGASQGPPFKQHKDNRSTIEWCFQTQVERVCNMFKTSRTSWNSSTKKGHPITTMQLRIHQESKDKNYIGSHEMTKDIASTLAVERNKLEGSWGHMNAEQYEKYCGGYNRILSQMNSTRTRESILDEFHSAGVDRDIYRMPEVNE